MIRLVLSVSTTSPTNLNAVPYQHQSLHRFDIERVGRFLSVKSVKKY